MIDKLTIKGTERGSKDGWMGEWQVYGCTVYRAMKIRIDVCMHVWMDRRMDE